MLFNSFGFIFIFLPISFFIYFYLNRVNFVKSGRYFLLLSNLTFYSAWNIAYLPLILISVIFNYYSGKLLIESNFNKKRVLIFSIFINLLVLGYFKYTNFFIDNLNLITQSNIKLLNIALPLAISFFTFQQIAYLVDSYRGKIVESNFLDYAIFVTFFPQLIAGPITYYKEITPQFNSREKLYINFSNIQKGITIFAIGLFKKVIIADTFAIWANSGFDSTQTLSFFQAWSSSLSYTFELYYDFSGYTDMAIGIALLFNIKLPINFNSPYRALSIEDFWRRWHITLSRFLKDYIYIPLGGNQKGWMREYINIFITFLLAGIWHGAGWTFILWGLLHGVALILNKIWKRLGFKLHKLVAWFITFNFINVSWVFFRAKDIDDALRVLKGMVSIHSIDAPNLINFSWIAIVIILIFIKNSYEITNSQLLSNNKKVYVASFFIMLAILQLFNMQLLENSSSKFIYFEF